MYLDLEQQKQLMSGMTKQLNACRDGYDTYMKAQAPYSRKRQQQMATGILFGSSMVLGLVGHSMGLPLVVKLAWVLMAIWVFLFVLRIPKYVDFKREARNRASDYLETCRRVEDETPYEDFCGLLGIDPGILTKFAIQRDDEIWLEELSGDWCPTHEEFEGALRRADRLVTESSRKVVSLPQTVERLKSLSSVPVQ